MSQKIKISILVEVEYEPKTEYYPPNSSILDMLEVDLAGANNDPYLTMGAGNAKWTITGEVVE